MNKFLMYIVSWAFLYTSASAQTVYFSSPPYTLQNRTIIDANQVMANYNRIISDGNTAYTAFLVEIAGIGTGATPPGAVVPFYLSACPTGWIPSDGTAGTVDLRGYFIVETDGSPTVGTVIQDQLQDHTHYVPGTFYQNFSIGVQGFSTGSPSQSFTSSSSGLSIGNAATGNFGSETRPKNVALLYCQKT